MEADTLIMKDDTLTMEDDTLTIEDDTLTQFIKHFLHNDIKLVSVKTLQLQIRGGAGFVYFAIYL